MLAEFLSDVNRYTGEGLQKWKNALTSAAIYPIAVYRFGHDVYFKWPRGKALLGKLVYKPLAFMAEWATGIYIAPDASVGPGLYIGHWGCTRIGRQVRLGANCNISPMVFIGFGAKGGQTGVPTLGDRVYVAAGAKIVGPIKVGSDVAVGANAVVCKDVPDHVTVGGIPAKVISDKGSAPYLQVGQALDVRPGDAARSGEPLPEAAPQPAPLAAKNEVVPPPPEVEVVQVAAPVPTVAAPLQAEVEPAAAAVNVVAGP